MCWATGGLESCLVFDLDSRVELWPVGVWDAENKIYLVSCILIQISNGHDNGADVLHDVHDDVTWRQAGTPGYA